MKPGIVVTQEVEMSEQQLIETAQAVLSQCNWTVGKCASEWCEKYANGRTDADFGNSIGLSGDQVRQRRRVWETFGTERDSDLNPNLKWTHYYVALNWEDAAECLEWASNVEATVEEMKAWRRAQRGEYLSQPAEDEEQEATLPVSGDRLPARSDSAVTVGSESHCESAEDDSAGEDLPAEEIEEPEQLSVKPASVTAAKEASAVIKIGEVIRFMQQISSRAKEMYTREDRTKLINELRKCLRALAKTVK